MAGYKLSRTEVKSMNPNISVLIVDDIPDHIAYAGKILKSDGYKVFAVTSGIGALEFLEEKLPDIIMLDIKMEDMDGLEVCRKIKSCNNTKDIPIIFMTSENDPNVIKKGFALGCCDYIVKPFTKEEYLARVKAHIKISRQSKELAAAYNELEHFCSAVSHDLKSPLNVMAMLIDELESDIEDNSVEEALKTAVKIRRKSLKLTEMINRLLEFSKMCNIIPETEPLDLQRIFTDIFQELKSLEPDRNVIFQCDEIPEIIGDEVLIEMMIKNIMTNAFKFTSFKDRAVITVKFESDRLYNIISIRDNGIGFDMSYETKLFKVFQRIHTSEKFEGNGVGLALCKRIIERHGGKIEAYGEVNKGAEFKLYFPK